MLEPIAKKVGVSFDDDPTVSVLEQASRPAKLAVQIDRIEVEEDPVLPRAWRVRAVVPHAARSAHPTKSD